VGCDHGGGADMTYTAINLAGKFASFNEQWAPRVVAEMNDYQFKIVKWEGDFILACSQGH
jgi:hypothetical protein